MLGIFPWRGMLVIPSYVVALGGNSHNQPPLVFPGSLRDLTPSSFLAR